MIGRVNYGSNSSYGDYLPSPRESLITLVIYFLNKLILALASDQQQQFLLANLQTLPWGLVETADSAERPGRLCNSTLDQACMHSFA